MGILKVLQFDLLLVVQLSLPKSDWATSEFV